MTKKLTVICPIYQENKFIDSCIQSIIEQDVPKDKLEVFFIDGMSTDGTREKVLDYAKNYKFISLLDNPHKVVPFALNIGLENATGDVIIRIDGHCEYPRNYFSHLSKMLFELDADNVGALWNTLPADERAVCYAIAIGSSHKFGVGASLHKVGSKEIIETDTVPFGCYKREVFDKIGVFDEELIRNQDDEFNGRLINNGGKIFLIPELVINYKARNTYSKMMKMYYQYGLFKPLVNKKLGKPATVRQFFPLLFLLGVFIGGALSIVSPLICIVYTVILILYFMLGIIVGISKAIQYHYPSLCVLMPLTFLFIHMSYGYGYFIGIIKVLLKKKISVEINR